MLVGMGLSLWPTVYEIKHSREIPTEKIFLLEHNFVPDYNNYLSRMLQGAQGQWRVYEKFTNEFHKPSLLQVFYLWLGKLGGNLGMSMPVAYLIFGRVVLGVFRLLAAYWFIRLTFPKNKWAGVISLALFVFGSGMPKFTKSELDVYLSGWSQLAALNRLAFLPHWMFGQGGMILILGLWWIVARRFKILQFIILLILILGVGLALPAGLVMVDTLLLGWLFFMLVFGITLRRLPFKEAKRSVILALVIMVVSIIPLGYIKATTAIDPWKAMVIENQRYRMEFPFGEYFLALGPIAIMGSVGLVYFLTFGMRKMDLGMISGIWIVASWGLLFAVDRIFGYDQLRFVQTGIELPLSIMCTYLILGVLKWSREVCGALLAMVFVLSLASNYVSWRKNVDFVKAKINGNYPEIPMNNYFVYPEKNWMEAIYWLRDHTLTHDVVLTGPSAGNYIPAYAGNFVYLGHGGQTVNYLGKRAIIPDFYSGKMGEETGKAWIKQNNIKWVFYGPEERQWGDGVAQYSFLSQTFKTGNTVLYEVR